MGRIRTIKPEFYTDEDLSTLTPEIHLMAGGLLTYADDYGYFNANSGLIKASLSPLRELSVSVPEILRRLQELGYLQLGKGSDGKLYGRVVNFSTHQRVSHPTPSKISNLDIAWEGSGTIPERSGNSPEASVNAPEPFRPERKGREGKGRESAPFNSTESAGYCMDAWHVAGIDNRAIIISVLDQIKNKAPMEAAVWLVEERTAYEQSQAYRETEQRYRKGVMGWLKDGTWHNWRGTKTDKKLRVDGAAEWEAEKKRIAEDRRLHPEKYGVPEGVKPCQLN